MELLTNLVGWLAGILLLEMALLSVLLKRGEFATRMRVRELPDTIEVTVIPILEEARWTNWKRKIELAGFEYVSCVNAAAPVMVFRRGPAWCSLTFDAWMPLIQLSVADAVGAVYVVRMTRSVTMLPAPNSTVHCRRRIDFRAGERKLAEISRGIFPVSAPSETLPERLARSYETNIAFLKRRANAGENVLVSNPFPFWNRTVRVDNDGTVTYV